MALGADRSGVITVVLRSALSSRYSAWPSAFRSPFSASAMSNAQLYETKGLDATVLVTAAARAGLIPALRASSMDPARALPTQ
jgi:hypothetical protein